MLCSNLLLLEASNILILFWIELGQAVNFLMAPHSFTFFLVKTRKMTQKNLGSSRDAPPRECPQNPMKSPKIWTYNSYKVIQGHRSIESAYAPSY